MLRTLTVLVTPSGMKIAYTAADLTAVAYPQPDIEWALPQVESVLAKLADGDARILRPVAPPGGQGPTRYEIFHDALGPAILDWRTRYLKERELANAIRKTLADVVIPITTFFWLAWNVGLIVWGIFGDHGVLSALIWTLPALAVWMVWTREFHRLWNRGEQGAALAKTPLAEVAAMAGPLTLIVIVSIWLVRRRQKRRGRAASGESAPAIHPWSSPEPPGTDSPSSNC